MSSVRDDHDRTFYFYSIKLIYKSFIYSKPLPSKLVHVNWINIP